ncbi:hypothetical protein KJ966_21280 [bacterium]|nr:hypothetical protein [bacterium]
MIHPYMIEIEMKYRRAELNREIKCCRNRRQKKDKGMQRSMARILRKKTRGVLGMIKNYRHAYGRPT